MSDLLSLLGLGSAAISAQNTGSAIAGNNVANANTAGYSRERVDLEALQPAPTVGGVISGDAMRIADSLLGSRIRTNTGTLAMSTAMSAGLTDIEQRLSGSPTLDERLATLFTNLSQVAAMPTDPNLRQSSVNAASDLASAIRGRASDTASARTDADGRIRDSAVQVTTLARELAAANKAYAISSDPTAADRRDLLATQLAGLVGGQARVDPDGQMRFVLDGGAVLVDGTTAASLTATSDPATGYARLQVVNGSVQRDVTAQIGGGSIGADVQLRDVTLAKVAGQLDQLAYDLTTSFNAVHTANAGQDGVSGRPMFTPAASVAGAASQMAVDPGLAADPSHLAAAAPSSGPGDNTGALALFQLSSQKVASGGTRTPTDAALDIIAGVGLLGSDAKADVARDTLISSHLDTLRDSISGVDVQEEMTNLAKFEHVTTALTKFVSSVNDMLSTLISSL